MYKIAFIILQCILCSFLVPDPSLSANPVNSVSGTVIDETTQTPIENANVYFSNTTWGSATDIGGYYCIRRIPTGFHELVVSVIGYAVQHVKLFVSPKSHIVYDFSLKPIIYNTPVTHVEGKFPDDWLEDLKYFKRFFLGRTEFSENCSIENEIYLDFIRQDGIFYEAKVDRPLVVINKKLGYRVDCALIKFIRKRGTKLIFWCVKPLFSELIPHDEEQRAEWIINRRRAYIGSLQHFLVSFFQEKVNQEKFQIWSVPQPGSQHGIYYPLHTGIDYAYFIQKGSIPEQKKLQFQGYWRVVFDNSFTSWIWLNSGWITLDQFGYTREYDPFTIWGEWAKEGVANLVPKDFILKSENENISD